MRLWKITDKNGKTEVIKAWSARHANFLATLVGVTILLLGRPNPDNPDGWSKRPSPASGASDGWKKR